MYEGAYAYSITGASCIGLLKSVCCLLPQLFHATTKY
jgi:hypothetical protein